MKNSKFQKFVIIMTLGLLLQGCDAAKKAIADAASGGGTAELATFVGNWSSPCVATANINGASAYTRNSLTINADGTGTYIMGYYSASNCTGGMAYMLTYIAMAYDSDTVAPANGKLFYVTNTDQTLSSTSAAGGTHLTSVCPYTFGSNSGVNTSGGYDCTDDRFDFTTIGTIGEIVLVKTSSTVIDSTAVLMNMPAYPLGGAGPTTSITWD